MPGYKDPPKETQFKPGVVSNPNGRPKGSLSLVAILKEKLEEIPEGMDKKTYAQLLVQKALSVALKEGDVGMIKDMFDRVDGKAQASVDVTTNGKDLQITVVSYADNTPAPVHTTEVPTAPAESN